MAKGLVTAISIGANIVQAAAWVKQAGENARLRSANAGLQAELQSLRRQYVQQEQRLRDVQGQLLAAQQEVQARTAPK